MSDKQRAEDGWRGDSDAEEREGKSEPAYIVLRRSPGWPATLPRGNASSVVEHGAQHRRPA
jgi:hypothetical protein